MIGSIPVSASCARARGASQAKDERVLHEARRSPLACAAGLRGIHFAPTNLLASQICTVPSAQAVARRCPSVLKAAW